MFSESPDFDAIAQTLIHDAAMIVGALAAGTDCLPARRAIAEQLRLVWNARGAADAEAIWEEPAADGGDSDGGPYLSMASASRAINGLDR